MMKFFSMLVYILCYKIYRKYPKALIPDEFQDECESLREVGGLRIRFAKQRTFAHFTPQAASGRLP